MHTSHYVNRALILSKKTCIEIKTLKRNVV